MNEESLFATALEMPNAAKLPAFLEKTCVGDARLRQRVEHGCSLPMLHVRV